MQYEWDCINTGATAGGRGYPLGFSLTRLGHAGDGREWLCTSLKIGLDNILLAQHSKQSPYGGGCREPHKHKSVLVEDRK